MTAIARSWFGIWLLVAGTVAAQQDEPVETMGAVVQRVRAGGWFEAPHWRRGDDGQLEKHYFADLGGSFGPGMRYQPLLGERLARGFSYGGAAAVVLLACHGRHDLLAMTDAEFHFDALGAPTSDVELRLGLLQPWTENDPAKRRAEVLDRLLAIDLLERRGHRAAVAELRALAARSDQPALRACAARALASLTGEVEPARRHLDPDALLLPAAFDACMVVEHARLPDLRWLASALRRRAALETVARLSEVAADRTFSPAMGNGAETHCDVVAELPFGTALQCGNARHDHSIVIATGANAVGNVGVAWQTAGDYELGRPYEHAQLAALPELADADLSVQATGATVLWRLTNAGQPRPELARELLRDTGATVRVVVPGTSRIWTLLANEMLPPAKGGELLLTCGDPAVVQIRVDACDERDAATWVANGPLSLQAFKRGVTESWFPDLLDDREVQRVFDSVFAMEIVVEGTQVVATARVAGVTPALARRLVESLH